jgi:hypothetical protein
VRDSRILVFPASSNGTSSDVTRGRPRHESAREKVRSFINAPLVNDIVFVRTLSGLLLGASDGRPHWFEAGKGMIAIDTLVHNFLHRSGILNDWDASHGYGVGCYGKRGCAEIIRDVASQVDASAFSARYPIRGSCNTRFGASAPLMASTSATAIALMTASRVKTAIARSSVNVVVRL